jgi:uncharacterized protein (TIGR03905 family)
MDENQTVTNITYTLGCDGNGKALAAMCEGLCANDIIKKLSGITCGPRKSSCPDQLAKGLKEALAAAVKK